MCKHVCYEIVKDSNSIQSAKVEYEKKITANLKTNSKSFFAYLRSKRKLNVNVTSLKKADGTDTVGAEDTASELASFFVQCLKRNHTVP